MNLELSSRLMRCRIALTAVGLNGAVIGRPENVFYLTGVRVGSGQPSFAVIGPQHAAVVAPGRGIAPSPEIEWFGYGTLGGIMDRIVDTNEERARGLVAAFAHTELQGTRVGIEDNYLMTASGLELLSHFPRELIVCGE